jgi:hypothetical protein
VSENKGTDPIFVNEEDKSAFMDTVNMLLEKEGRVQAALDEAKYIIGDLPADEQARLEAGIRAEVDEDLRKRL